MPTFLWHFFPESVAWYILYYQTPLSGGMIQAVLNTDLREGLEQAQMHILPLMGSLAGFLVYLGTALKMENTAIRWRNVLMAIALWDVLALIYYPYIAFEFHERFNFVLERTFISYAYPYNLFDNVLKAAEHDAFAEEQTFELPAIESTSGTGRQAYVLVIGESARESTFTGIATQSHWFHSVENLIYFSNALAQANYTSMSVKMLISGASHPEQADAMPSLIHWQNAMGCQTAVFSNNTPQTFTHSAKIIDSQADAGVMHHTRYDHDLLPMVAALIRAPGSQNICITLHMVGSHMNYEARYRKEFAVYPVSGNKAERTRSAYKNSIVMTLDFIHELIRILDRENIPAFLVYTSDHGENLMEINGLREHVTLTPTHYELKVPVLFWASNEYVERQPLRWERLRANRNAPISNANLLPTLLDAMGIATQAETMVRLQASLFKPYVPVTRSYVTPDGVVHLEEDILYEKAGL